MDAYAKQYTLPDINGISGTPTQSRPDEVSIYPLFPELNCSGTVTEVGFCYYGFDAASFSEHLIFTLLTLEQNEPDNLIVSNIIPVYSTPSLKTCTMSGSCCDVMELDRFHLPTENFAFGLVGTEIRLLTFARSTSVRVEHHRLGASELDELIVGDTISVDSLTRDRSLKFFQFFISKL